MLPPSWKGFKHNLKHKKEEFSMVQLGCHIRIEESLCVQDCTKNKVKTSCWTIHCLHGGNKQKTIKIAKERATKESMMVITNQTRSLTIWFVGDVKDW